MILESPEGYVLFGMKAVVQRSQVDDLSCRIDSRDQVKAVPSFQMDTIQNPRCYHDA